MFFFEFSYSTAKIATAKSMTVKKPIVKRRLLNADSETPTVQVGWCQKNKWEKVQVLILYMTPQCDHKCDRRRFERKIVRKMKKNCC